ncbi:hypothetical protein EDB87DRAFT_1833052 [Lactarius vividus]|nr:hypothetical protein EDB87DRAFT_1833052 [Lactarius vividus]
MLFYKPLVSLVTVIALTSSVTASATPTQYLYCCTSTVLGILGLGCVLDPICSVGTAVCCDQDVAQNGLINIGGICLVL